MQSECCTEKLCTEPDLSAALPTFAFGEAVSRATKSKFERGSKQGFGH